MMVAVPLVAVLILALVDLDAGSPAAASGADVAGGGAADHRLAGAGRADGSRCGAVARRPDRLHRRDAADRQPLRRDLHRTGGLAISPLALGVRLFAMLAGAAIVAAIVRRIAGQPWLDEQIERIDGLNVIALFVFAVALMDGVLAQIAQPAAGDGPVRARLRDLVRPRRDHRARCSAAPGAAALALARRPAPATWD